MWAKEVNGRNAQSGGANKLGTCIDTTGSRIHIKDSAGTKDDIGDMLDDVADDFNGSRNGHGDLNEGNATMGNFFDGETSVLGSGSANHRDQTNFLDSIL